MSKVQRLYLDLMTAASQEQLGCRSFPDAYFMASDENDFSLNKLAIEICNNCPIQRMCLEYAVEAQEPYGIWGGKTAHQRRELKGKLLKISK